MGSYMESDSKKKTQKSTQDQHYVPQFYLRQWCDSDKGFYPIKVETKMPPKLNIFKTKSNPSRFCYENYFYAQHTGVEDQMSQEIEKAFADIEGVLHKEIPKIEEKILRNEQITPEEKYHLCEFMTFIWIKGKAHRMQSQKMTDKLFKELNKHWIQDIDRDPKMMEHLKKHGLTKEDMVKFVQEEKYTVDVGNAHHLSLLQSMYGFCNLLANKYWKVFLSREGNFITTDAPYMDIAKSDLFWGNDFLSREQIFILSPRVVIAAVDPHHVSGKKLVRKDLTGDKWRIQQINMHNLMNAIMFGFHRDRDLLEDLERVTDFFHKNHEAINAMRSKKKSTSHR